MRGARLLPPVFEQAFDAVPTIAPDTVREFLNRGAKKAVDIIYEAVGPVGPPVRPGSGSLFIVDERRLVNWRDDGWAHSPSFRARVAPDDVNACVVTGMTTFHCQEAARGGTVTWPHWPRVRAARLWSSPQRCLIPLACNAALFDCLRYS